MTKGQRKVVGALVVAGSAFVGVRIYQNAESTWIYFLGVFLGCVGMSIGVSIWSGKGVFGDSEDNDA